MTKSLAILGAGGHGKVVADAAQESGQWGEIIFFDDRFPARGINCIWKIVGTENDLLESDNFDQVIVAIGENKKRLEKTNNLINLGMDVTSVKHPAAIVSSAATIKPGSVICAGAIINAAAKIGKANIINTGAIVEHDCQLGDGVHISPNAAIAGRTIIGARSWLGIGAVTKQGTVIGADSIVGAGAVVVKSISEGKIVAGNPAKVI